MAFPALTKLFNRYLAMFPEGLVASPVFTDQTSPSERRRDQNHIWWQPTEQSPVVNFERIEAALERPIHPTIQSYFRSYWAGPLYCTFNGKPVELIQLWNPEEFEHLIENVVGHFLQQRRFKQSFTFFFAVAELSSEITYSIDNVSGQVLEEVPGPSGRRTIVASDLAEFLARLQPEGQGELHA